MNNALSTAQTVRTNSTPRRVLSLPSPSACTFVRACVRKLDMVLVLSLMAASIAYAVSAFAHLG